MEIAPRLLGASSDERPYQSLWTACASLILVGFVMILLFRTEVNGAVTVWIGSTAYNHCFLITPMAMYLVWDRRAVLAQLTVRPTILALPMVLLLSLAWIFAVGLDILEVRQFLVIAMFEIASIGIFGWRTFRQLMAPFLFLFLLVPTGDFLVPWLQSFTAHFVVAGLQLAGIPVFGDGTIIEIPAGTFVVAEACAVLRFLVVSVSFGVFYAVLVYRNLSRRIMFITVSFVLPVIANGFRAFGIVYLAHLSGSAAAVEADHVIYGWGFFAVITILLIWLGNKFSQSHEPREPFPTDVRGRTSAVGVVIAMAIACVALLSSGPVFARLTQTSNAIALSKVGWPRIALPWHAITIGLEPWRPKIVGAQRELFGDFTDGKELVTFDVAIFARGPKGSNLVRAQNRLVDENRWQLGVTGNRVVKLHGADVVVETTQVRGGNRQLEIWHFFVVDGQIISSRFAAKLAEARSLVMGGDSIASQVSVATDVADTKERAEIVLQSFLNSVSPLPQFLHHIQEGHSKAETMPSGMRSVAK